jgi:hypothetical protein
MIRKILLFGLPVYLYVLEVLLKTVASLKSESLLGLTLAGAGMGFLLPLTELKKVNVRGRTADYLDRINATVYSRRDKTFVDGVWFVFFVSLVAWMYALFLTFKQTQPSAAWINLQEVIGILIFVISVVLSEVKERI